MADEIKAPGENNNAIHLLRTAQQHHVQLSVMADQKANFLLTGNFVVLSVVTSGMVSGKIGGTMLVLGLTAIISSVFAVLAVMPRFRRKRKDGSAKNLLFFGDIGELSFEDYWKELEPTLKDSETIFRAMARDIYEVGKVLRNRKYRFLQWSYRTFFYGLLLTGGTFLWERFFE